MQWLTLERLANNDLPLPKYQTSLSAGIDFAACLTRQCRKAYDDKASFWALDEIRMITNPQLGNVDTELPPCENRRLIILPDETIMVPLGFKCAFDSNSFLGIYIRSSIGMKGLQLANNVGIVDADYRGELFAAMHNRSLNRIEIKHGERIVQGILTPFSKGIITEGKVDNTERGDGGFGSTGKV